MVVAQSTSRFGITQGGFKGTGRCMDERTSSAGGTLLFRDSLKEKNIIDPVEQHENEEKDQDDEALFCQSCLNPITRKDQAISINGSHTHTFFNPEGIVFELGCFREAAGCLITGEATSEFTWFPGSVWRFALCRRCGIHLGWTYDLKESGFYGLILNRLRE